MSAEPFHSLPPRIKEPPPLSLSNQQRRVVLGGGTNDANRNLILGVLIVLLTIPLGGAAFWWAPRETFVAVSTAVLVGLLIFLAMQFRVLLQRNGTFLILSIAFAVTLVVPLAARMVAAGSDWMQMFVDVPRARAQLGGLFQQNQQKPAAGGALQTEETSASAGLAGSPGVGTQANGAAISGATGTQPITPKFQEAEQSKLQNSAPALDPEPLRPGEDPVQRTTRLAKEEAVRLYPSLQTPGTPEHTKYIEAYNDLARLRKYEFFKDPRWPLTLAETVAAREGWQRAASPSSSTATSADGDPQKGGKFSLMPGSEIALDNPQSPASENPETQAVNRSMIEIRRRYPAIGTEGSPENQAYLEYYKDLERARPEFFDKPDWPVRLGEAVARREGWKRADGGEGSSRFSGDSREPALPR